MSSRFERPAFGQKVALGTLYNAHTDTFQDVSLFSGALPTDVVDSFQHQKTSTELSDIDSHQGRFSLLGISPELGASLLSGLAPAGGCGNCLHEPYKAIGSRLIGRSHYSALHHRMAVAEDVLLLNSPALREHVMAACLQHSESTHVVTGITWGSQTVVTARCMSQRNNASPAVDDDAAQKAAQDNQAGSFLSRAMASFRNAVDALQYIPNPDLHDLHLEGGVELDVAAHSEVFDAGGMVLRDLREAFDLIQLLPLLLQHSGKNVQKGEPISYALLPLQTVAGLLGIYGAATSAAVAAGADGLGRDSSLLPIVHNFLNAMVVQFDEVAFVWSRLVDYASFLAKHKPYAPSCHVADVEATVEHVQTETAVLKQAYAHLLADRRMTQGLDRPAMEHLHDSLLELAYRCVQILDQEAGQHVKISLASKAVACGAIYVGHNGVDLDKLLCACAAAQREAFVLRFSQAAMAAADEPAGNPALDANQKLLGELLEEAAKLPTDTVVIVLDCDALGQPLDRVQIAHQDAQGKSTTQDLHEQRLFEAGQSFARYTPGALESGDAIQKPVQRRMAKIPCPGNKCSSLQPCHWICSRCHGPVEYGYSDDYLYCDCGRAKFDKWQFKCNSGKHTGGRRTRSKKNKSHGDSSQAGYVAYKNKAQLLSTLKSLDQADYVNILILGETGVGKSTFINALVNYLSFETLDEAKQAEALSWVIPCAFSIQTMDRSRPNGAIEERKIQIGGGARDDEADGTMGASATQQTAVYPVNIGSKTIRLIDTPGIGDTRGLAFDKKNMADILRTLSSYEQLHGILILLKSNNARLTVTFNFCMQELLTHLHRSASRNMAFGFTNTRISNFSPGDTFGPLTALLGKHRDIGLALENQNTFCFDSESFRFLAAFQHGITMENEADFRRSWAHSRDEAVRLVAFFQSKVPHQVKSTLSLNGTRQLIAELTKPMADISQLINTNIKLCADQIAELHDTQLSGDKLRQRLQVPKAHLKTVKLDRPRTVCRNEGCVDWRDDGSGSVVRVYKHPCHNPCYLTNVEVDRVSCPELMSCTAFLGGSGFCGESGCGHSWQEHLHVYFELEEYTAMVTDTEAERLFRQNESDITVKQAAVQTLEDCVAAYQAEHATIQEAAARFGIFLKRHAITPYNDATLEYLDLLIQDEKQKARVSRDTAKLGRLRKDYEAHVELVQTLENSMAGGGDKKAGGSQQLDEAGVEAVVRGLYGLEHFGQMLRDVKDGVVAAHQATYRERPFKVQGRKWPPPSSSSQAQPSPAKPNATSARGSDSRGEDRSYRSYVLDGSEGRGWRKFLPW